ncbi:MAG TPA: AAA family ATPase [Acidimicrobiales bacterium]|nr:AAA family ATPase [Acidimicrobiales bacterium]
MTAGARAVRALFITLAVVVVALLASLVALRPAKVGSEVRIDELPGLLNAAQVKSAVVLGEDDRVILEIADGSKRWAAFSSDGSGLTSLLPQLSAAGVPTRIDQQPGKRTLAMVAQFILPLLLLANLFGIFILLTRGGTGQVRDLFAFSRMGLDRSKALQANPYRFANVAAIGQVIEELEEIAAYLRAPERFAAMGALPPKGVLLSGPPGCGKTLLARALAGEVGVPFYFISGSEFVESLVGVGAARVRDLFRQACATAPALIFIDELDAAGRRRGTGVGGGHDEREQTLNELLVQMDGFASTLGVVVIGATNRPDILDPALLRPGRFDRHIVIEAPDVHGRAEVLALHARSRRVEAGVDLAAIARTTPGCTGADLANIMNEAALLAVRAGQPSIGQVDLEEAVERAVGGPLRQSRVLSPEEVERLAVHEAGHVVVSARLRPEAGPKRASIVARGRDLAHTDVLVRSDRTISTQSDLLADLAVLLSGVAAEALVTGEVSTAGEGDIEKATALAREYAGRLGMTPEVGRVKVLDADDQVFLGRELAGTKHQGPTTLEAVDNAVRDLIGEAEERAAEVLRRDRSTFDAVQRALVTEETLDELDLVRLLARPARAKPTAARSARRVAT